MTPFSWLISMLWLALIGYWARSAAAWQRSSPRWIWWREIAVRLGLFSVVLLVARTLLVAPGALGTPVQLFNARPLLGLVGLLVTLIGIGLAIVARGYFGRTWGTAIPSAHHPELMTRGPYALVRHPIYAGLLLAMLGSAVGQSVLWLLPLCVYGPHFILSARREEKLLSEQFPQHYQAYRQRTRMLVPFVL